MGPGERAYRKAQRRRFIRSAVLLYTFAAILILIGLSPRLAEWWFGVSKSHSVSHLWRKFAVLLLSLLIAGVFLDFQSSVYAYLKGRNIRWLRTTPWRPGLRLPLARRSFEPSDMLLVAPIIGLCAVISPNEIWISAAVLGTVFLFRLMLVNLAAERGKVVAIAFLIALSCALDISLTVKACVASAAAVVLILGALNAKPAFELIEPVPEVDRFGGLPAWVRRQMPLVQHESRQRGLGLKIAGVVFWLAFCILHIGTMTADEERTALSFSFMIALIIAVARWAIYVGRHHAPISLRGRWQTGTWLIPSHDRMMVAPLVSTIVVLLMLTLCLTLNVPFIVSIPLLPAVALAICIESGPTLRNWTLTGRHNVPRSTMKELSAGSNSMSGRK